jgi:hypothetical protein
VTVTQCRGRVPDYSGKVSLIPCSRFNCVRARGYLNQNFASIESGYSTKARVEDLQARDRGKIFKILEPKCNSQLLHGQRFERTSNLVAVTLLFMILVNNFICFYSVAANVRYDTLPLENSIIQWQNGGKYSLEALDLSCMTPDRSVSRERCCGRRQPGFISL